MINIKKSIQNKNVLQCYKEGFTVERERKHERHASCNDRGTMKLCDLLSTFTCNNLIIVTHTWTHSLMLHHMWRFLIISISH